MKSIQQLTQNPSHLYSIKQNGYKSLIVFAIFFVLYYQASEAQSNLNTNGSSHRIDYTGDYVDFVIPSSYGTRDEIRFTIKGADGGRRRVPNLCKVKGGGGASVSVTFKIGTQAGEVQPGGIIRFIVGGKGESNSGNGTTGAGGGAGSAVLYQHPGSGGDCNGKLYSTTIDEGGCWHILGVAGGGGGAYTSGVCGGQAGKGGTDNINGSDGYGSGGTNAGSNGLSGTMNNWASAGGGGGARALRCCILVGERGWYDGGDGGHSSSSNHRKGGWGFGGGGAGKEGAGGGGGFSGGGAGATYKAGGGGGSIVNPDNIYSNIAAGGKTGSPNNGYITYRFQEKHPSAPNSNCKNIEVQLDQNGEATVTVGDIKKYNAYIPSWTYTICDIDGTNCGTSHNLTCADLGQTQKILRVTNYYGSDDCIANIEVSDDIAPTAVCSYTTIQLDQNGRASILPQFIGFNSSDNCGISNYSLDQSSFDCFSTGTQTVVLTVSDDQDNSSFCTAQITIRDNIAPRANCNPATVSLDANGEYTLARTTIDNNSYDNCFITRFALSKKAFTCQDLGANLVTLTVTDQASHTASCNALLTITDQTGPQANCQAITIQLDAAGQASIAPSMVENGSYDICPGITGYHLSKESFTCADLGQQAVTLTVTDASNNSSSCSATVDIKDEVIPIIHLLGDPVVHICQGETYIDAGTTITDNCQAGAAIGNIGSVNTAIPGTYTVTYAYTDPQGNIANAISRTILVEPTPLQLSEQACNGCGEMRFSICQYDNNSDLKSFIEANHTYNSQTTLNWYTDNNDQPGNLLVSMPIINTSQSGTQYFWVSQQLGNCEGEARKLRVRVKKQFAPDFNLPSIGCGGSSQINLAAWVSDPRNKAMAYTFFTLDPSAPGAQAIGSVSATKGVVDASQYVLVNVLNGSQTYWVESTVPNGCGAVTSSTLNAPAQTASLSPINNLLVNSGDPVNLTFQGQHATHILWFNSNNPYIGMLGSMGSGNLSFTAVNSGSSPLTATIRVIPYNGNCAGAYQDVSITVLPSSNNRQSKNMLSFSASQLNAHDVQLDWQIDSEFEFIRFEVEKKRNDGEFTTMGSVGWKGNQSYTLVDVSGMGNVNQYRLKLILTNGSVIWSEVKEVTMNFVDNKRFTVFPNPNSGQFQVKALFPMSQSFFWQISDGMGKVVKSGYTRSQLTTVDIESLSPGIYHLMMISPEGKRYLMKVIKQ